VLEIVLVELRIVKLVRAPDSPPSSWSLGSFL
jgi:hypothetical protein